MNDNFVNVKVDREERPDVDKVYMTFVQVDISEKSGGKRTIVFLRRQQLVGEVGHSLYFSPLS